MNDINELTPKQLRQAANLKERIESLQKELNGILGETTSEPAPRKGRKGKRKMSAEGRANIIAAVKARWAGQKAGKVIKTKKARVPRVDQSEAVIGILKKAGKPLGKQEIVKALGKDFKPNSWIVTIAKAKKNGVKQKGDKAAATYLV